MDTVPSYPYVGPPESIMQDVVAASNTATATAASTAPPPPPPPPPSSQSNKRRRLDEASAESATRAPSDAYEWSAPAAHAHAPTFASGPPFTSAAVGAAAADAQTWHSSENPSYPDHLAPYQQQPYFYSQAGDQRPHYHPSWAPPVSQQSYGTTTSTTTTTNTGTTTTTTSSYSAPGPAAATTAMPFFPPQPTPAVESRHASTDLTAAFTFPGGDAATAEQYASYTQPSATAALAQREAAKSSAYYFDDASMHLKIQSLPILDNLATQLIHTISKANFPQIQDLMRGAVDSEDGQAYKTLKNLFDQTRKVYSRETPFIDAIAIQMFQPNQQEIIRKANIATFISSILGAHDVSFFHLNEFFMETFVPLGHRLLKWQGAIYLELKTQIYISALMNSDGSPEAMLDELFPPDLDAQILTRHPDAPSLSPSEQDFIDRSRARKSYLLDEPSTREALQELPKKYQWNDFVREFASCITKNVDGIMNVPVRSQGGAGAQGARGAEAQNGAAPGHAVPALALNGSKGSGTGAETKRAAPAASTIRQPWTKPEEDALLAGLERVNGPHWSQILALYGRGGSVSEVLKDRNQVQLKDKARNLKLWYLKTGKEVPPALRGVTGELRKRGGARARAALGLLDDEEGGADDAQDGEVDPRLAKEGPAAKKSKKKASKK